MLTARQMRATPTGAMLTIAPSYKKQLNLCNKPAIQFVHVDRLWSCALVLMDRSTVAAATQDAATHAKLGRFSNEAKSIHE